MRSFQAEKVNFAAICNFETLTNEFDSIYIPIIQVSAEDDRTVCQPG